ncbi:MAG: Crp/Fnr family transcriptional regulator [Bacteroidetes bacterium]|nr:Crp/Fnr family transcriptional regulator [Bacteroidota bacterium]MBL6944180.1 Crp/Fnr family transcriptional regulator [Bacteroidales bacterium]
MKLTNEIESCNFCFYRKLLFDSLNDAEYQKVNVSRKEYVYNRGEIIRSEGDPINSFMYLRSGLIKLYKTDKNGKDHILSLNKPGDFISLLSIFSDSVYKYSIAAIEETKVCDIELQTLNKLITSNSEFALRVLNRMSRISDDVIDGQFEISKRQVKGRIAYLLLFLSENIYHKHEFRLPITRREIGELISMTTENTIRTLSEFRKDGVISMSGKIMKITDYKRLESISKTG